MSHGRRVNSYAHLDWSSDGVWAWGERVTGTHQQWVAKYTFKEWDLVYAGERSEEPQNADEVASEKVSDVAKRGGRGATGTCRCSKGGEGGGLQQCTDMREEEEEAAEE